MRKKFLSLFFALGCTTLALAQVGVTLQNPSFEEDDIGSLSLDGGTTDAGDRAAGGAGAYKITSITGWTLTNVPSVCDIMTADATATDNDFGAPGAPSDGTQMLYLRDSWNSTATTTTLTQKVTLAAGTYKVTVDSKCIHNGYDNASTAKLVAGGEHAELPYHTGFVPTSWDETSVTFRIDNETEVEIGVEIYYPSGQDGFSVLLDNFTLTAVEDVELTAHYEEADISHWSTTGNNGTHELNTWSTETDVSGMAVPFCQNWVWEGEDASVLLTTATISHKTLQGLPAGTYDVSMDIRIFSEAGNAIGSGTTFNANGVSEDLDTGSDGHEGTYGDSATEVYGNYKLTCTVGSEGTLDISLQLPDSPTYNWIAWKDLKVVMDTKEYPTLTAPTGEMDPTVQAAMEAAIAAYNANPSGDNFFAAIEAIQDAYASIAAYAADLKGGDYLIVNQEGYYLGGGLAWGTQATIIGKPQFIGFEVQSDGTYHLDSHQYNGANDHYLGSNLYFDNGTPVDWTIEAVDGGYTIYGNGGYLTSNGFQTAATVEATPYVWTLLTMDDVVASMDEASATNPVDVTALIQAPELKHNSNTDYYPTWTVTGYDGTGTPSNYSFGNDGNIASCAESYHSTNGFNFSQEITLPKAGYYTLSAKGFWRDDGSTDLSRPVLYAGNATSTFPQISRTDEYLGVGDNMANAYQEFLLGLHSIDAIPITATQDGETITIGFKGDDTSLWNIMGELELLYYADAPAHECTADLSHWSIDPETPTSGDFHQNTWSTEADASELTTPFLEYWVYDATLSAATISHETIEDLDPGVYEVSMDIRIFSEAGSAIGSGTTFNANGVSEDLVEYGSSDVYGTETEVYGTYTLTCTVGEDGTLDISIVIPDGVTYNWISFKDLKVVYVSGPIEWTLGADYGTLILPFDYDLSADTNTSGLTAYTVDSITDATGDESATLNLSTGITSIAANTPYIMGGTAGTYSFIGIPTNDKDSYDSEDGYLTGYMVAGYAPAGSYVLQDQTDKSGLAFYLVESAETITVGAYHCYLNYTATAGVKMVVNFPDGTTTGIDAVESESEAGSGVIYDLGGRKVAKAQKGIYIVDGKKVVIK